MEKEYKKKLNILGIIFAVFSSIYAITYGIIALFTPLFFRRDVFFGFLSTCVERNEYALAILFILTFLHELLSATVLIIWCISLILKFKNIKLPLAFSLVYCILSFALEISKIIFMVDHSPGAISIIRMILSILLFTLLLLSSKNIYKMVFMCVGYMYCSYCVIINSVQLLHSLVRMFSSHSLGTLQDTLINYGTFYLKMILYVFFILYIFKPEIFYRKVTAKEEQ